MVKRVWLEVIDALNLSVQIACACGGLPSHSHAGQKQESDNAETLGNLHTSPHPLWVTTREAIRQLRTPQRPMSSDRLWCNTAGIRSFEPWVPPLRLLLPPFAASTNR